MNQSDGLQIDYQWSEKSNCIRRNAGSRKELLFRIPKKHEARRLLNKSVVKEKDTKCFFIYC